jgi:hypothetical protein
MEPKMQQRYSMHNGLLAVGSEEWTLCVCVFAVNSEQFAANTGLWTLDSYS